MAKKDAKLTASTLIELLGGEKNIKSYTNCMTRLRVKIKTKSKIDVEAIKKTPHVINIIQTDDQVQIILGTGFVRKVADEVGKQFPEITSSGEIQESKDSDIKETQTLAEIASANKDEQKNKNTSSFQKFMSKFANIFTPLIFGFIGAGILAGVGGILQSVFTTVDLKDPLATC